MIPLLALGLSTSALAHYPHDPATFVAVSPGASPEWVLTSIFRNEAWVAARSNDDRNMDYFYIMGGTDTFLSGGAMLGPTHVVLSTEGLGLWQSPDAGESWSVIADIPADADLGDVEASPEVLTDGIALAAGDGGIWRTEDGGSSWSQVLESEGSRWLDLDLSADFMTTQQACAVSEQGQVVCSEDGGATWLETGDLEAAAWSITVGSTGEIFVGLDAEEGGLGGVHQLDAEGWTSLGFDGESVTTIESLLDGTLLLALPLQGVWKSTDQGESWALYDFDLERISPDQNGPRGEHFFEFETTSNGSVYLASWEGLVRSDNNGTTWNRVHTALQQTIRDVDLALDRNGELLVLMASYGGGLQLADLGGTQAASLNGVGQGLYLRHAAVTPNFGNDGIVMVASSGDLMLTQDAGETWQTVNGEGGETHLLDTSPHPNKDLRLFSNTTLGGNTSFFYSTDQGLTWVEGTVDIPCSGNGSAFATSPSYGIDGTVWVSCTGDGSIYQSLDRGESWTRKAMPGVSTYSLACIEDGSAVLAGTADGLIRVDEDGSVLQLGFNGEQIHGLAASSSWKEDPTILVISAQGSWARSADGGDSWEALEPPAPGYFLDLVMSPEFTQDGVIVAAGYPGVFASIDSGQTWQNLNLVQLHEEVSAHFSFSNGWHSQASEEASGGGYSTAIMGERLAISLRAEGFDLLAPVGPELGTLEIRIGSHQEEVSLYAKESAHSQVVWSYGDLSDSWHTLEVEVVEGTGAIDAIHSWSGQVVQWEFAGGAEKPGDTGEETDTGDEQEQEQGDSEADTADPDTASSGLPGTRCSGCAHGRMALLFLLPLIWQRRSRT